MANNKQAGADKDNSKWVIVLIAAAALVLSALIIFTGLRLATHFSSKTAVETQPVVDAPTRTVTEPPAVEAFLEIEEPSRGTVLDLDGPVMVSGSGAAIPDGIIIVQAIDEKGNVLAESETSVDDSGGGIEGKVAWSSELTISAEAGTPGQILALSPTTTEEGLVVSAARNVTFGEVEIVEGQIQISSPEEGAVLDAGEPIIVDGIGKDLSSETMAVQALDMDGSVLAEKKTTLDTSSDGTAAWSVELSVSVETETPGEIIAESSASVEGGDPVSAKVAVTFSTMDESVTDEPFIMISEPQNGAFLDSSAPIVVNGTGGGLFEGNVVVQALDNDGEILDEVPTIIDSPEAGIGGIGPWSVELNIQVSEDTPGKITAFSPSPVDGSNMAFSSIDVNFTGSDSESESDDVKTLWMLVEIDGQDVLEGTRITAEFSEDKISGSAGCNNYFASYEVKGNRISIGIPGSTRMFCSEPEGIMDQESQYLGLLESANSFRRRGKELQIYNRSERVILVYKAAVTGTITYRQRIALPEDAVVTVKLSDVSIADAAAITIGEQVISNPGQVPIPFEVYYDPEDIDPRFTYAVQVRITDGDGKLLFINTTSFPVITHGNPSILEVIVEPTA